MFRSRLGRAVVFAAAACALPDFAQADVQIDVRATLVNGAPLSGLQTPHFIPGVVNGDVIAFDVYAIVSGTDLSFSNDRIIAVCGSFKSTTIADSFRGDIQADVVRTTFDGNGDPIVIGFDYIGFSVGTQQDLDADGDIDVGSNVPLVARDHWIANYAVGGSSVPAGVPGGRQVGFGTYTVTNANGAALLNYFGRNAEFGARWVEDGIQRIGPSHDSPAQNGILVTGVPEPSAIALLAVAGLSIRRGRR